MNPLGLIIIALGLIMIVIGFKGSQHSVIAAFKGVKGGKASPSQLPPAGSTTTPAKKKP